MYCKTFWDKSFIQPYEQKLTQGFHIKKQQLFGVCSNNIRSFNFYHKMSIKSWGIKCLFHFELVINLEVLSVLPAVCVGVMSRLEWYLLSCWAQWKPNKKIWEVKLLPDYVMHIAAIAQAKALYLTNQLNPCNWFPICHQMHVLCALCCL